MSNVAPPPCEVFLSYSLADAVSADIVSRALSAAGMSVIDSTEMHLDVNDDAEERLWNALVGCDAIVLITNPAAALGPNSLFELGATSSWDKPSFILIPRESRTGDPSILYGARVYPLSGIDEVASLIRRQTAPMNDDDREKLLRVYQSLGVSTDQILREPEAMKDLARKFERRSGKRVQGTKLAYELLRLRKNGQLPRHDAAGAHRK